MSPAPGVPPVSVLQVLLPDEPLATLQDMTTSEWNFRKTEFAAAYQQRVDNLVAAAAGRKKREADDALIRSKRQATAMDMNWKKVLLPENKIYGKEGETQLIIGTCYQYW